MEASNSKIIIVDEAEYGLEPFRITQFLNELGSKNNSPDQQVFMTTHSPYLLRELSIDQLHVLRKNNEIASESHIAINLPKTDANQGTLRACSEAFFSPKVIICEGPTEVGLIKGIDLYKREQELPSIYSMGGYYANGGGDPQCYNRASVFAKYGFETSLFKDSDKPNLERTAELQNLGVTIFEWGSSYSTEDAVINWCDEDKLSDIIELAIELNSKDEVERGLTRILPEDVEIDQVIENPQNVHRSFIATASKGDSGKKLKSWFKSFSKGEELGRQFVGPQYDSFENSFQTIIESIWKWVLKDESEDAD